MKSIGFAIGLLAILAATGAGAIVGGVEVAVDDPGGRAAVIVTSKHNACTGLVYGDSYIITNAHCLMNEDFTAAIAPQEVTITYGRALKQPDAEVRRVTALTIHENFLKVFTAGEHIIDSEDIALIRIAGTHPSSALGAELPTIYNDYVVCCVPRPRAWPLVWMDVYGFGASPKGEVLHKLRVSAVAPNSVWKRVGPKGLFYRPRQLATEESSSAGGPHGICHGDSGGPAFLVAPRTWTREAPGGPIRLVRGHPLAIGLVTWGNDELEGAAAGCSNPFYLVRLDYYGDWIRSHVRQMQ